MIRLALLLWILFEIAAFALAGQAVGVLGTLGLVLLTAVLGGVLLRAQGAQTLAALRGGVRRGGDPLALLLRDGFRLVAALLLILPGFLGDVVGLLLLLPPVQRAVAADLARRGVGAANLSRPPRGGPTSGAASRPFARDPAPRDIVIEADWEEVGPSGLDRPAAPDRPASPDDAPRRPSGWTRS